MINKDIKKFLISNMKESDWRLLDHYSDFSIYGEKLKAAYVCEHLTLAVSRTNSGHTVYYFTLNNKSKFYYPIKEIGLSNIRFRWLLTYVGASVNGSIDRAKKEKLEADWKGYMRRNKQLDRDVKLNEILK